MLVNRLTAEKGRTQAGVLQNILQVENILAVTNISLDKLVKCGKLWDVEKCNWPRMRSGAFCFLGCRAGVE
jgi:hypothetical protein